MTKRALWMGGVQDDPGLIRNVQRLSMMERLAGRGTRSQVSFLMRESYSCWMATFQVGASAQDMASRFWSCDVVARTADMLVNTFGFGGRVERRGPGGGTVTSGAAGPTKAEAGNGGCGTGNTDVDGKTSAPR